MPIKLPASEKKELDRLAQDLAQTDGDLASAVTDFNGFIRDAWAAVQEKLDTHNEARASMREFLEGRATEWREQIDAKSQKWQEGDKGLAASEFVDEWENAASGIDDYDLEQPEDIELDTDLPDFDALPQKPDEP